ncbi:unnamed protein product [Nippostrongylus brasiliensis]|uniref:THAP-type domain-containing protein n=1 Tax=Nippostrongylus brasiliensis TaxID=27835 RepID=A0A0N4XUR5_NIPBR|nr:unnamed protein product [Nippostrongylus brasiliensis]
MLGCAVHFSDFTQQRFFSIEKCNDDSPPTPDDVVMWKSFKNVSDKSVRRPGKKRPYRQLSRKTTTRDLHITVESKT